MIDVISFSGGRTSAYLSFLAKNNFQNPHFVFMDTGAEHPETYEFIRKVDESFGLNLICLRGTFESNLGEANGYTVLRSSEIKHDLVPFKSMMKKYGTPTILSPWCTSRMKQEIHDKFCDQYFGKGNYATWLGIRSDEPKRLKRVGKSPLIRFLAEISDFDKQEIIDWWSKMPFDLGIPERKGNCVFCIKKSIPKLAMVCNEEPELFNEFLEAVMESNDRDDLERPFHKTIMYRGKNSLTSLKVLGETSHGDYMDRMSDDKNSCEESCELFQENIDS